MVMAIIKYFMRAHFTLVEANSHYGSGKQVRMPENILNSKHVLIYSMLIFGIHLIRT